MSGADASPAAAPGLLGRARATFVEVAGMDPVDLAARLSLVYLLYKPFGDWYISAPIAILAAWGLVSPVAARGRLLWFGLFLLVGWRVVLRWYAADNHWFLLAYWCLALLCVSSLEPAARRLALAWNGRVLLGCAFAFATLWKVGLSPDFMDGRFMRQTLLVDRRFEELSILAGGASQESWDRNQKAFQAAFLAEGDEAVVSFEEPPGQIALARAATWWTAAIEGAIAVAFLWPPGRGGPSRVRDPLLLVFTWTTYPFATVAGFGWLLMVLGVAQCEPEKRRTRLLYVATFFLVLLFKLVPWAEALVEATE